MAHSKAARYAIFSATGSTNSLRETGNGGGMKKGGAFPYATGQMRSFDQRSHIGEPAKRKDFVFQFRQFNDPARHSGPML